MPGTGKMPVRYRHAAGHFACAGPQAYAERACLCIPPGVSRPVSDALLPGPGKMPVPLAAFRRAVETYGAFDRICQGVLYTSPHCFSPRGGSMSKFVRVLLALL